MSGLSRKMEGNFRWTRLKVISEKIHFIELYTVIETFPDSQADAGFGHGNVF